MNAEEAIEIVRIAQHHAANEYVNAKMTEVMALIRTLADDLAAASSVPALMRIRTHSGKDFDIVSWSNVPGSAESTVVVRRLNGEVFRY